MYVLILKCFNESQPHRTIAFCTKLTISFFVRYSVFILHSLPIAASHKYLIRSNKQRHRHNIWANTFPTSQIIKRQVLCLAIFTVHNYVKILLHKYVRYELYGSRWDSVFCFGRHLVTITCYVCWYFDMTTPLSFSSPKHFQSLQSFANWLAGENILPKKKPDTKKCM